MNRSSFLDLAKVALFASLMAVFGLVPKIDLPFGVPITLQNLGVMLAGCLLGARLGLFTLLLFLFAVAIGLPLLSGGRGGPGVFFIPSSGYLLGWPLGALITGWVMGLLAAPTPLRGAIQAFIASVVGGVLVVHATGVVGLMLIAQMEPWQALTTTLIFVPGDLIKCGVCALVVHTVIRHRLTAQAAEPSQA